MVEVVETCSKLLGKASSMVEVVGSCRHMAVVETCSQPLATE
ncbi:BnaCnng64450D, partial [Brassica napus]